MKYVDLNLDSRLLECIQKLGYQDATPIQEKAFDPIVKGQDVAGLAQTGTGKTAAFLIPLIERILKAETHPEHERAFKDWKAFNSILILVPTRELADQIHENIQKLTAGTGLKSFPLYGGTGYEKQKEALSQNLQFIVSTPGRLIDLYKEHFVDFKKVKAIVFDEADRMFDMGFKDDMKYILSRIERNRQFLVFSATLNFDVLNTAYQFGSEPVEINISKDVAKADNVKDVLIHLGESEKPQHVVSIIKKENPRQTIIFTNYKNSVDRLAQYLTDNQIPAMGLSSLISQNQRNRVISQFKEENNQNVLVATDVAARGLDISNVDLVINFELPQDSESYVHRIGRTGRAGETGKAYSLVCEKDVESLQRIEEYTKKKIETVYLEDSELIKDLKPMAASDGRFNRAPFDNRKSKTSGKFDRNADRKPRHGDRRPEHKKAHQAQSQAQGQQGHGQEGGKPRHDQNRTSGRVHVNQKGHQSNQQNGQGSHRNFDKNKKHQNQNNQNRHHKGPRQMPAHLAAQKNSRNGQQPAGIIGSVKSFFKKIFG